MNCLVLRQSAIWGSFDPNNILPQKSVSVLLLAQKVVSVSILQWIGSLEKRVQDKLRVIIMMNFLFTRG
jgi:hypothetical protein